MKSSSSTAVSIGVGVAGVALAAWLMRRRGPRRWFAGKVVVITGGSRGLGLLIARRFAAEGARVALLARTRGTLELAAAELRAAGAKALAIPCDVRDRVQVDDAIARVHAAWGGVVDVLVNCAGVIQVGPLEHMQVEDFQDALATHLLGPLHATLAVLPDMRRCGAGRIVNVSSIGGKVAIPHLLPYCASKFALVGLSDGLRAELRRHGIRVTTVCPGLMRTGSAWQARVKGRHRAEFAWFALGSSLPLVSIDADRAADRIVRACARGDARLIITPQAKALSLANELAPGLVAGALALVNRLLPPPLVYGSPTEHSGAESESALTRSPGTELARRAAERNLETA